MKTLDAVVPVYNEEAILAELNRRLTDSLEGLPYGWRIIYVDDGSRDGTGPLLARFAAQDPRVCVVHLSRNFGQQLAISAGLSMTTADAVVTYEDFGAKGDGKTDDINAIAATHAFANQQSLPVKANDGATYYIGGKERTAIIKTDSG